MAMSREDKRLPAEPSPSWSDKRCGQAGVSPAPGSPRLEQSEMKQIHISCEHCAHRIHFHDRFRRDGQIFYHALCWELSLAQHREKLRACAQPPLAHIGPPPAPRSGSDYC